MRGPRRPAALLAVAATAAGLAACATQPMHGAAAREAGFVPREVVVDGRAHRYQVFVPGPAAGANPPVILFLHGSGERGDDGTRPTLAGLGPYARANAERFPAIVVFPQVPEGGEWQGANVAVAFAALDAATDEFDGDRDRTYLTGMSMGGYGTWELALAQPRRFAALVPVCGAVKRREGDERPLFVTPVAGAPDPYARIARTLRDVPVWIFHGARDDVVAPGDDRRLIAAFRAASARDARYTEFPDANHNAWDPAYARTPALWRWLFAQRRR
ncbi:prolyl oligopeptidase family serine peptidase [Luteimonas lutimaris]|uniref:Prolyl oligopeptidase family serine peptidase n=1 Tax=Luteimonas lutimaris TaxID=698645 RepID=A0ABP7MZC4_9GAMM